MFNLPVIITPLRTYLYGQTSFWMEVICLQHLLIEYLKRYNFFKTANANSIFANMKSIIKLSCQHFLADMNNLSLKDYCLKSDTKRFRINNCDCPFSTLLHIGNMTGGSVIWPMPNMPTLLQKSKRVQKQVILWCGWLFLVHLKLIKLHT